MNAVRRSVINRVLPQFFPKHWLDAPGIVFTDFPSRIAVGYVLRGDTGGYSYIIDDQCAELGISVSELHAAALANLARVPSAISVGKVPGGAEGWIHGTEDNFVAARILLPEVQKEFTEALGEPFLVSLSHRDDCFCWSVAQPPERQQKHIEEALERFVKEDYNLTPDILRCARESFTLHLEQLLPTNVTRGEFR